ncbi:MAG: glycosyltransferase [Bauldia litoralis]
MTLTDNAKTGATQAARDEESVFKTFIGHIRRRQKYAPADADIRDIVDQWRAKSVSIGFPETYLKVTFGTSLLKMFRSATAIDEAGWEDAENFVVGGSVLPPGYHSHPGCVRVFQSLEGSSSVLLMDTGYLASVASWTASFRGQDPRHACLGYVYDDIAHYFMSDYPGRIARKLNSAAALSHAEEKRARAAIDRILAERVSKYNNQPFNLPAFSPGYSRRVLVVDQSFADASTIYGGADEDTFQNMLLSAIRENPDAEIIVKTHPDSLEQRGKREGFYSGMVDSGRVRFLRRPVNPFVVFDVVDKVYVASSQMGFEAAMAGKHVICFGVPIYAGWGFTEDRKPVPHRHRQRSIVEFFHYFYIWYTRYFTPDSADEATVEQVLDYIVRHRSHQPTAALGVDTPEVSVVIPVHGVEKYIEECIASVQAQTLRNIEIIPVNDCTPDDSQDIVDQLVIDDPRIRPIILRQNVGQGFARNKALDAARGEYVFFLDGDDYLRDPELLARLVAIARKDKADMVRAGKSFELVENEADGPVRERQDRTESHFGGELHGVGFAEHPEILHNRHFWNFLYRRDFLEDNEVRFTTTQWEERPFLLKALLNASSISTSAERGLVYRVRGGSTARRAKSIGDVENHTRNFAEVVKLFSEKGAGEPGNALNYHFRFTLSQYIQYVFFGFPYATVMQADKPTREKFLARWSEIIVSSGLTSADLLKTPEAVDNARFDEGVYGLIVEAARRNRPDLLAAAAALRPIPAETVYGLFDSDADPLLVAALNRYAQYRPALPQTPAAGKEQRNPSLRVIIHAGASKTGSSFVQHFLDQNRPALIRRGVWTPEFGVYRQPGRPHKIGGHSQFFKSARRDDPEMRIALENGLALLGPKIHTIVISSEGSFLSGGTEVLVDYLRDFNPELLIYFRRQDDWANSQYAEFAGGGALGRISSRPEDWLATRWTQDRLDYEQFLRRWLEKLPKEKVHVRPVERTGIRQGVILDDFIKELGIDKSGLIEPTPEMRNELKLSKAEVETLRSFNDLPFPDDAAYLTFVQRAHEIFREGGEPSAAAMNASILSAAERRRILERVREGNAWIAREFLGREDLFAELDVDPVDADSAPELRAETVGAIVAAYNEIARPGLPSIDGDALEASAVSAASAEKEAPVLAGQRGSGGSRSAAFVEIEGRRIEKSLDAIRKLPNSQIVAVGLLLAEGQVDPRKLDVVKKEVASKRLSKRRVLAYVLRRHGRGVLRANLSVRDRLMLLLRG